MLCRLLCSEIEEQHSEQNEKKVNKLSLEVLLVEDGCTEEEADDDRTAADHADDTDHGSRQAQCVEIYEIGSRKEDADEDDAPMPMEWGGVLLGRPPYHQEHGSHEEALVDVVPALHDHSIQSYTTILGWSHQILVVETAYCTENGSQHDEVNPLVVLEVDALLLSAARKHGEGDDGKDDTNPLVEVEYLAVNQQGTHECHYRTGGIDRPHDGEWQMLHAEITEDPTAQYDETLEHDLLVNFPSAFGYMEHGSIQRISCIAQDDERQEDE